MLDIFFVRYFFIINLKEHTFKLEGFSLYMYDKQRIALWNIFHKFASVDASLSFEFLFSFIVKKKQKKNTDLVLIFLSICFFAFPDRLMLNWIAKKPRVNGNHMIGFFIDRILTRKYYNNLSTANSSTVGCTYIIIRRIFTA